jgi:hypothetical protein
MKWFELQAHALSSGLEAFFDRKYDSVFLL